VSCGIPWATLGINPPPSRADLPAPHTHKKK
jgi:hypothetical protein